LGHGSFPSEPDVLTYPFNDLQDGALYKRSTEVWKVQN
jgi:hypothetical protein